MTSEGPHRTGHEPDEVSPGAGGPAPYGDRPAQPDNGNNAAGPDLGWAPPPPARPDASTPAWATQSEQPPAPAWGAAAAPQPNDPPQPAWGAAPAAQPNDPPQPAWAAGGGTSEPPQQQPGTWPGSEGAPAPAQPAWATPQQQGWTPAEQSTPAPTWTPNAAEQPDWAQPPARGAAQVPPATTAWPAQEDPANAGGWGGPAPTNPPTAEWRGAEAQQAEPQQAANWSGGAQQNETPGNGGWPATTAGRDDQPVWTPAEQSPPTWGQPAEPAEQSAPSWGQAAAPSAARGAAQVPAPPTNWPGQDDPARSGGWAAQQQQAQPAGWGDGDARQEQPAQPAAWGDAESRPQQPDWVLSPQDQPAERPEPVGWTPAEQSGLPSRASVSVPGKDGPPEVEPWAPGEVWGRAEAEAAQARGGWEADRGDEAPAYQPGPAPGISPANAVPLPPQEQRVPGASLAAAPPSDYAPQAQFAPIPEQPAYAERETPDAPAQYEADPAGWGRAEDAPASGAVVPAPRTSPESGAGRAVVPVSDAESAAGAAAARASASVPLASRVMPPTDQAIRPTGTATPQPRVYGRPARPEPENEPEPEPFQVDAGADRQPVPEWQSDSQRQAAPDWQNDSQRQAAPDWQNDPPRQAAPDWQNDPPRQAAPDWQNDSQRQAAPDWQNDPQRQVGPGWGGEPAAEPRFDDRQPAPNAFGEAPPPPPAFPPGVPSFVDAPGNNRPVNGTRPHGGAERPADQFGGPGSPAAGTAAVGSASTFGAPNFGGPGSGGPGFGGPAIESGPGGSFPPAFPPPPQPAPSWGQEPGQSDQGRFDAFKPDAAESPKAEPPTPKVRNGRVLAAVLIAAVLILAVPLGLLLLLGKVDQKETPAFDPAVGTCVKQAGEGGASAANCGEAGSFTIVSKVDAKEKCADPTQPHVVLPGSGANRVLCLKPATK
ncbi:LppU/SCO3897 family protein [Micromonospora sp. DT231]|uniref:LppU/SCO3897 family protein n=1 Tax=Micromonospora sp. DT231 TaxID=3416526 RepID=UPI003CEA7102